MFARFFLSRPDDWGSRQPKSGQSRFDCTGYYINEYKTEQCKKPVAHQGEAVRLEHVKRLIKQEIKVKISLGNSTITT